MRLQGDFRQAVPEVIHTFMPIPTFHEWLRNRSDEAPAADNLATLIASAGVAGISHDRLRALVHLSPETMQDIIRSLVATGQVVTLKVDGQMTYRTTM
jgi:hypothetical protein